MAHEPARRARLSKGQIALGSVADLVALAPDEAFTVDAAALHHRNPVTPYEPRALTGVVCRAWLRGVDTRIDAGDERPRGRLIGPDRASAGVWTACIQHVDGPVHGA